MSTLIHSTAGIRALSVTGVVAAAIFLLPTGFAGAADTDGREFVVAASQTELRFWQSVEDFAAHMTRRVEEAMEHSPDLIVFPEDIGLPLVALGDADLLDQAESIEDAIEMVMRRHAAEIAPLVAEHAISPQRALWIHKAPRIRAAYERTFSDLAREHTVHIAAGSVPMVFPEKPADVFNTACVFDPTGEMHIAGTKVNLVAPFETEDGLDFSPGSAEDYAVVRMPGATVGIIVCADGWDPNIAARLAEQGAEILVQVSANPEVWTEGTRQGWQDSLFSRVEELGVHGVCVMGVGNLLGLPFQGRSCAVAPRRWTADGSGFIAEVDSPTQERLLVVRIDLARAE
ncbi:MAG: carbon-nitrogen hydrolase family protein [Armatimonadota bacterium]